MLSNREFTRLVESGSYPDQVIVPLDPPFVNENGEIRNLLLERFTSAAVITSVAGSVRANHYHKTDWHYSYVLSGTVDYYHRPQGSRRVPSHESCPAGTMFFTPPMVEHAMVFPAATVFLTFAKNIRDHEHHEADVVRIALVELAPDRAVPGGYRIVYPGAV
jgi:hypothetical protein